MSKALAVRKKPDARTPRSAGGELSLANAPIEVKKNILSLQALKMYDDSIRNALNQPTPAEDVKVFPIEAGKKAGIAFVTDNYVKRRLDEVFSKLGWKFTFTLVTPIEQVNGLKTVVVHGTLSVWSPVGWIDRQQYGGCGTDLGLEAAMKGAATDALKKCSNLWGIAEDVYDGAHHKIKAKVKEIEQKQQQELKKEMKDLPGYLKDIKELSEKLERAEVNTSTRARIVQYLLPKKKWKRSSPVLTELNENEASIVHRAFEAILAGTTLIEVDDKNSVGLKLVAKSNV